MTKRDTIKRNSTEVIKAAMIEALTKSLGIVTTACKQVEISRETHYRWMQEDEKYKSDVEDISDVALDFAESMLHKQIEAKDTAATIFYLKTKGKRRGYIERSEVDHNVSVQQLPDVIIKTK
jgi:hypothetical protein